MSRTKRKTKKFYEPGWVRELSIQWKAKFYGDSYNHDDDPNPPVWFKTIENRKFRHRMNVETKMAEDPVIPRNFKMPYYT